MTAQPPPPQPATSAPTIELGYNDADNLIILRVTCRLDPDAALQLAGELMRLGQQQRTGLVIPHLAVVPPKG